MIGAARAIARFVHRGQRYGSKDFFEAHVVVVADRVRKHPQADAIHIMTAYLHDCVEDGGVALDDLRTAGFPDAVIDAVDAISRRPDERYGNYIERVASDPVAALVKRADLRANLHAGATGKRAERYHRALYRLTSQPCDLIDGRNARGLLDDDGNVIDY